MDGVRPPDDRRAAAPRFEYVDGVRALAALYVVLHHMWIAIWPGYPENEGPWWTGWLVYGHVAVAVFIVVSGFSLGIAPARNAFRLKGGAKVFFHRRAWRILPAYWAALILATLIVLLTGPDLGAAVDVRGTITHGLLVQNVFGGSTPNGAFWSIAIEVQIYLFFPLLLIFRRRFGLAAVVLTVVALTSLAFVLSVYIEPLRRIQSLVPQFAALFVLGMAGAELALRWHDRAARSPWARFAGVAGLTICAFFAAVGSVVVITYVFWIELVIGVVVAVGLAALADGTPRRTRSVLESRPLRWLGSISYSTYLIHAAILLLLWTFLIKDLAVDPVPKFLIFVVVAVPAVVLCSHYFSKWIEQPTQRHRSFKALGIAMRDAARSAFGGRSRRSPSTPPGGVEGASP